MLTERKILRAHAIGSRGGSGRYPSCAIGPREALDRCEAQFKMLDCRRYSTCLAELDQAGWCEDNAAVDRWTCRGCLYSAGHWRSHWRRWKARRVTGYCRKHAVRLRQGDGWAYCPICHAEHNERQRLRGRARRRARPQCSDCGERRAEKGALCNRCYARRRYRAQAGLVGPGTRRGSGQPCATSGCAGEASSSGYCASCWGRLVGGLRRSSAA